MPPVVSARRSGVPVIGELELVYRLTEATYACVTGTNGKSTTTVLLGDMLEAAGLRPVVGGNLPSNRMREAMGDAALDASVTPPVLMQQREAIRTGHCDLLPETQLGPMTRIQLARDRTLAQVATAQLAAGRTVLLIAGNGHVRSDLGVPLHLAAGQTHRVVVSRAGQAGAGVPADAYWDTPALPEADHCAGLRARFKR